MPLTCSDHRPGKLRRDEIEDYMSQSTTGSAIHAMPNRPAAAGGADAPDILFIVKHYRWMLSIGTLVGLVIGVGAFFILMKT
jgi:hypothetical protein